MAISTAATLGRDARPADPSPLAPPVAAPGADVAADVDQFLDRSRFGLFHLKVVITSGMGFFTDAYDLTVISTALILINEQWHLSPGQIGLLGSSALISSALGAFGIGRLADVVGRKRMYGLVALVMVLGALATAVAPSFGWLLVLRFILGAAIGGDYPVSAVLMTEYANVRDRGRMVAMMFVHYALGSIAGPLVAVVLLALGLDHGLTWRLLLGLGAVPSLCVLAARRRMPESPRYVSEVLRDTAGAATSLSTFAGTDVAQGPSPMGPVARVREIVSRRSVLVALLGTAGVWFVFDIAYYGNTISAPVLLRHVDAHAPLIKIVALNLVLYSVAALPAFSTTIRFVDRIGHVRLQMIGLLGMAAGFAAIGLIPSVSEHLPLFVLAYVFASFFCWFGPGVTTMVLSAELFATEFRSTAHGFAAGWAKVGAFIGALIFPPLLHAVGLRGTELVAAVCCLLGVALSALLREPSCRSLKEMATAVAGAPRTSPGAGRAKIPQLS